MQAMRIRDNEGSFTAVVGKASRIYTPYVRMDSYGKGPFIIKRQMANGDMDLYATPLTRTGKPYPVKRAINHMLRIGRANGITKAAKKFLLAVKKGCAICSNTGREFPFPCKCCGRES